MRADLIWKFYQAWKTDENARHASKRYLSTLAVLQLDAILAFAKLIKTGKPRTRLNIANAGVLSLRAHSPYSQLHFKPFLILRVPP